MNGAGGLENDFLGQSDRAESAAVFLWNRKRRMNGEQG